MIARFVYIIDCQCQVLYDYIVGVGDNSLIGELANTFGPTFLMKGGCVTYLVIKTLVSPPTERRVSAVVSTSACHAGGPGSLLGPGTLLGVKTWLSTLEIVYLCVFRMRH